MFGKLTNRDQTRWQIDAARALVDLLRAALKADLPEVKWSISGMRIVGQVIRVDSDRDGDDWKAGDGLEVRDVFTKWCDFVNAEKRHETTVGTGRTHLHGEGKAPGHDRITVMILADIYQEDEQQ